MDGLGALSRTVLLAALAAGCAGSASDGRARFADPDARIGAVFHRGEVVCLLLRNDSVVPGAPVWIRSDEVGTFAHGTGRVVRRREECAGPAAGAGHEGYEVDGDLMTGVLAFGVLGALGPVQGDSSTGYRVDIDGDGEPESFRTCPSSEGVHMTVWTGEPLTGTRRWHHYHYLGYDIEPGCDPRDYEGTEP